MNKRNKFFDNPIVKNVSKIISWILLSFLILIAFLLIYNIITSKIYEMSGKKYEPEFALYTIISPSMEPNINVYDVIITKKVKDYSTIKEGDIITFVSSSSLGEGLTVTHRVKNVIKTDDDIKFRTQGDNNPIPDSALASSKNVLGKVLFKLPWVGHIQFFLQSKVGWLFILLIPAMGVVLYDIYKVLRLSSIKQKVSESTKDLPEDEKLEARKEKLKKSLEGKYKNSVDKNKYYNEQKEEVKEKENSDIEKDIPIKPKKAVIDTNTSKPIKVEEVSIPDNRPKNAPVDVDTKAPQKVKSVSENKKINVKKVMANIDKLQNSEKEFNVDNIMANIKEVQKDEEVIDLPKKR